MADIDHKFFHQRLQQAWRDHQSGRLEPAEHTYRALLQSQPGNPDLNNLAGLLYIQTKRPDLAETHIRRALKSVPGDPQSLYNLGISCADQHKWPEAIAAFGQCVRQAPDNPDLNNALGNALRLSGRLDDARPCFERALKQQPGNGPALLNIGLLHAAQERHSQARQSLEAALRVGMKLDGPAWNDLGVARNMLEDVPAALEAFKQATRLDPQLAPAWLNRGILLERNGELEGAEKAYSSSIQADPELADAHFQIAHLRTHTPSDEEITQMRTLFDSGKVAGEQQAMLAFGMAMAHESLGHFDQAFTWMEHGHQLQADTSTFDVHGAADEIKRILGVFSKELIESAQSANQQDARPVFISGLPRSGTTLAEQIISSHSKVEALGERMFLSQATQALGKQTSSPYPESYSKTDADQFDDAGHGILAQWPERCKGATRVTDTTPMNFRLTGAAAMMLPGARFIHCRRDPMDNGLSIFRQYLTGTVGFEHDLDTLGAYICLHDRLLAHWQEVLQDRIYVLDYEKLVTDQEAETRRLLSFCGLEFEPACLRFNESGRTVNSPSASQVHQPLYSSSVGSSKNYQQQLKPLATALEANNKQTEI